MARIEELTQDSTATADMQMPVYDPANAQPRKLTLATLLAYIKTGLTGAPLKLAAYTVADLTTLYPAAGNAGAIAYCSNGNSGTACLAMSNGASWLRLAPGIAISAT